VKTMRVNLGARSYPIRVGVDILGQAGCMLAELGFRMAPIVASNSTLAFREAECSISREMSEASLQECSLCLRGIA
jgi:hypothetical protein